MKTELVGKVSDVGWELETFRGQEKPRFYVTLQVKLDRVASRSEAEKRTKKMTEKFLDKHATIFIT